MNVNVSMASNLCSSILDSIAQGKLKKRSVGNQIPWMKNDIHNLRRECSKSERAWKSTKLLVHFEHLKNLLVNFNY